MTTGGVDAFVENGRIAWMRVGPKTHFFDDDHPQTLYVDSMRGPLRSFFESYSDEQRLRIFGPAQKRPGGGTYAYWYDYPDRGLKLLVFTYVEGGKKKEELAEFVLQPIGKTP